MDITIHYTIQTNQNLDQQTSIPTYHTGTHASTYPPGTCKLDALTHTLDLLAGRVYSDHSITRTTFTQLTIQITDTGGHQ